MDIFLFLIAYFLLSIILSLLIGLVFAFGERGISAITDEPKNKKKFSALKPEI